MSRRFLLQFLVLLFVSIRADAAALYQEPWRPQFHFTPQTNWMNDPNGLVFYEGEYHLFHQFNPEGRGWGHMSWGHAVSRDLVHWEQLPIALREENNVMIFSGSAVVDWKNTSGFGTNGRPPLVAIYTGHHNDKPLQQQSIAYSNDRGRTWTKYAGNPVLNIGEADFRDPKVFWHEPTKRWIMTIAWCNHHQVRFYASPDLKSWTHLSDFGPAGATGGAWECPDMFPLPLDGKSRRQKWVLIVNVGNGGPTGGSGCQYFVGHFDGKTFALDEGHPRPTPEQVPDGIVLADFEGGSYGDWRATGDAFGTAPATGTLLNQQAVAGFRGHGLINTYRNGDATTGTLTSPEFTISRDHLGFLIGGGRHPVTCALNLLVDGAIVRTATGDDSERLAWKSWEVRELRGRKARLEIVDRQTGGWGHLNVDHILLADTPPRPATTPVLWADHGSDYYAAVSWSDLPKSDGRRLWIGWMSNLRYAGNVPTAPWRSAMSLPRELELRSTPVGPRLFQQPVRELANLREKRQRLSRASLAEARTWLNGLDLQHDRVELELELDRVPANGRISLRLVTGPDQATILRYDAAEQLLSLDRTRSGRVDVHPQFAAVHSAPLLLVDGRLKLRLFIDTSSVEVFAQDGSIVLTDLILPTAGPRRLELEAPSAPDLRMRRLDVWPLKSIWPKP